MSSSCRPPVNTTYLVIGQDLFSIDDYVKSQYNYSIHRRIDDFSAINEENNSTTMPQSTIANFVPAAFMVYTDLATLNGLWEPTDYGSGIEYADGILDLFPLHEHGDKSSIGLQIGLWLNGTKGCFSIVKGDMDKQISLLVSYLNRCRATKIFLRLGYEFDNPTFGYSDNPEVYVLAFRKLVKYCRKNLNEETLKRVLFVWHSWGAPLASDELSLDRFYPGDDVVDWIGVSIFQQVFPWSKGLAGSMSDVENVFQFARDHSKPTMVAESTPFGGIELKQASNYTKHYLAKHHHQYEHDVWERWFGNVIDIINKHDVSMWCYINCDWESMPQWHGVGFGETRISSNEHVMSQWYTKITNYGLKDRKFLFAGSLEYCDGTRSQLEEMYDDDEFSPFISYILVPFLLAAGAFLIPYCVLGKRKKKTSNVTERRPLLANIDQQPRMYDRN